MYFNDDFIKFSFISFFFSKKLILKIFCMYNLKKILTANQTVIKDKLFRRQCFLMSRHT